MNPRINPSGASRLLASLGLVACLSTTVFAQDFRKGDLLIHGPYAMTTAPGQPHGAVFFESITNNGSSADQLIGGRSSVSKAVEVHRMEMANNVMKMREIPGIDLPSKTKLPLDRGSKEGYHLMLMDLKVPLKEGDKIPMTLVFKRTGEVEVMVSVQKPSAPAHGGHKH